MKPIAIKIESKAQFEAVKKYNESKGLYKAGDSGYDKEYQFVSHEQNWSTWSNGACYDVISFEAFSQLTGVTAESEEVIIHQNRFKITISKKGALIESNDDGTWEVSNKTGVNLLPATISEINTAFNSLNK